MTLVDHGEIEGIRHNFSRRPEVIEVQHQHLKLHPQCAACGVTDACQAHHVIPYHYCEALGRADLSSDPRNFITLCETEKGLPEQNHHLLLGHLGDFKEGNLSVVADAQRYHGETKVQLSEDAAWLAERKSGRLKALDLMTDQEKADLRALMDRVMPPLPAVPGLPPPGPSAA